MIENIHIEEFALIECLDLRLGPGLNILTGETGAGKSVIVEAINMALGERADANVVRSGAEKALAEIVVRVDKSPKAIEVLRSAGFEPEDGTVIISREIHKSGRSQCRINGRPATVSLVKELTDKLVDVHGQHEHQSLLRTESHLEVLDGWCGEEVLSLRSRVAEGYSRLRELRDELSRLQVDERERARRIDLYKFQIAEIERARLAPGEEEQLEAEFRRLANAERVQEAVSLAYQAIGDRTQELCALDRLAEAISALSEALTLDEDLKSIAASIESAMYQLEDAARLLRKYRDAIEFNPHRLSVVQERLEEIRALKRKYGDNEQAVLDYGERLKHELDALCVSEQRSAEIAEEIARLEAEVLADAEKLSARRRAGARQFSEAILKELADLGMPKSHFEVHQETKGLDSTGIDKIEFLISTNPGEPIKPLARIASGGEISRIMLAMKSVAAGTENIPTLIFDEIDVGVGGRTAEVIARKLATLSNKCQVICVTHLPQIASRPGEHFGIEKQVRDGRSVVRARRLSEEERIREIARMLGGAHPSATAVRHAQEMLGLTLSQDQGF